MAEDKNLGFDVTVCRGGGIMLAKKDFKGAFSSDEAATFLDGYSLAVKHALDDKPEYVAKLSFEIDTSAALKSIREIEAAADDARAAVIRMESAINRTEEDRKPVRVDVKSEWLQFWLSFNDICQEKLNEHKRGL